MAYELVVTDEKTGKRVLVGDTVTSFRGTVGTLKYVHPPGHGGSSGHVTVIDANGRSHYNYPSVWGVVITEVRD